MTPIDLIALYRSFVAHAAPGESRLEVSLDGWGKEVVKLVWDGPGKRRWAYSMTLNMFDQRAGSAEIGRWLAGQLGEALADPSRWESRAKP